eukprot:TRINITY_DN18600_c0_g1_i1.p1 TRINITY_DN18600_c0_g1~~TRINITY_DN18600_c0_g1_i1.p1  ORF type:complete len:308 (+),score=47.01 TRINITY_DN18600_c0_g1_i1:31-924(+)
MFRRNTPLSKISLTVLLGISLFLNLLLAASVVQLTNQKTSVAPLKKSSSEITVKKLYPSASIVGRPITELMWEAASDVIKDIDNHEFLTKLLDSSLPIEAFQYYIQQDAMYLEDFGRALAALAFRSTNNEDTSTLLDFSKSTIFVESAMHQKWLESPSWKNAPAFNATGGRKDPVNALYTSFLLKSVSVDSWEVGAAAVTPCFWIYLHVGKRLLAQRTAMGGVMNPYYETWVQEYAAPEFEESTNKMLDIVNRAASASSPAVRSQMIEAFVAASKMESMFWGMGLEYVARSAPRYTI